MTTDPRTRARSVAAAGLVVATAIAFGSAVSAHRLDEYLQATRLDVRPEGVLAAIELTPGAAVAASIITTIDRDADGVLSRAEELTYARAVVASLEVVVDDTMVPLRLDASAFPTLAALRHGEGTIRLQARADRDIVVPGMHHLSFTNGHAPRESVYVANALMPDTAGIVIERQRHSPDQSRLSLDYSVEGASSPRTSSVVMAGLVAAVLLVRMTRARMR
ncbi:hypothetical protein LuPra_01400 [Luteitalea pratensis]|uniref:Uncharacterized protein n=1 Tax=Luteitalea pratensis TaxID=1855912 RepID=A0A143PI36_LUTPR|nr:hypothetical protein [Luteitalea pratensis]AMY08207.1 hypothetical protein LuPra_01400 [Luteitalea pratensis]